MPRRSRPHMPSYGVSEETADPKTMLPWEWAVQRLSGSRGYWIASSRPSGRPHLAPVWGIWLDDRFWFSTSGSSVKVRNIDANPQLVVTPADTAEAVIVEGEASRAQDPTDKRVFVDLYCAKYDWDRHDPLFETEPIIVVAPSTVLAFTEADLVGSAARWHFD